MTRRITIKDVAARAGVSHPTVSRVIHDDRQISDATKQRIRKIMKELGYRPNLIARGLVRNKTQVFAIVIPDFNPHVQPIVRGIVDECRQRGYAPMLFSTEYWTEEDASYSYVVSNWRVDGVLIYNVVHHDRLTGDVKQLKADNVPFVFINKYLRKKNVNTVAIDNFQAVGQVVEHLASLGHRRIGILNGSLMAVDGVERLEAFKEALSRAGLAYEERNTGNANFSDSEAEVETKRILAQADRPTAIFCANDLMALGAIRAAKSLRLRVPSDISFIGFDDLEAGRWFTPALSTLQPPLRDIGAKAIDLLLKTIQDPRRKPEQIPLFAKLLIRESSGPAPSKAGQR
ncbi:MAG: LacI family DNA-binding transcriptional regulator [Lentisphaerota bacterium]